MFVAAAVLRLVAALFMIALSAIDHCKSPRPSTVLTAYLYLSLLMDAAQAITLFLSPTSHSERVYSGTFCAATALKAGILVLEAWQKTGWVRWPDAEKDHSP